MQCRRNWLVTEHIYVDVLFGTGERSDGAETGRVLEHAVGVEATASGGSGASGFELVDTIAGRIPCGAIGYLMRGRAVRGGRKFGAARDNAGIFVSAVGALESPPIFVGENLGSKHKEYNLVQHDGVSTRVYRCTCIAWCVDADVGSCRGEDDDDEGRE